MLWLRLTVLLLAAPQQGSECDALADSIAVTPFRALPAVLSAAQDVDSGCAQSFKANVEAGRTLSRALRTQETASDVAARDLAERLLRRAVTLEPLDARALFELGRLWRYRYGVTLDAQRALARSVALADRAGDTLPSSLRAEILFERAVGIQQSVDRTRWLRESSGIPVTTPACSDIGAFCENFTFPQRFNELLREAPQRTQIYDRLRDQLLSLYRRAIALDSSFGPAVLAYARELALAEEWAPLLQFAGRVTGDEHSAPALRLIAGMALYRLKRFDAADSAFRSVRPELPDSLARWLSSAPPEMPADWANRGRPLWVTANELQLEYWSRLALAHLVFGDQEARVEGLNTPQGETLLRYGWPRAIMQIARDDSRAMNTAQTDAANETLSCLVDIARNPLAAAGACEPASAVGHDRATGGGRWIFWTYESNRPSMIFEARPLPHSVPQIAHEGPARDYNERLARRTPFTFRSSLAETTLALPIQIVRFRGPSPAASLVRVYASAPRRLREAARDSVSAGVFLFGRYTGFPLVYSRRLDREVSRGMEIADSAVVLSGDYAYSVEILAPRAGIAAVARDTLTATTWPVDSLSLSDVLVARSVTVSRSLARTWRDLRVTANPTLQVKRGDPVWIVWETYGLSRSADGVATYQVSVGHSQQPSWHVRLLRRLGVEAGEPAEGATISWSTQRPLSADTEVVLEAAALSLPDQASGTMNFTLTVTEPSSGRTVRRPFRIVVEPR